MFASCSDNTMAEMFEETKTIDFKLGNPSWTTSTRAGVAGSDATISADKLQLLCFDSEGGFVGVVSATSTESATVPAYTNRIHFLLNYETTYSTTNNNIPEIGINENTLIPTLTTSANENKDVVCWGYIGDLSAYQSSTTIPLIRNVAKVTVAKASGATTISDVKLEVYNDNDHGTIAPFDASNLTEPFNNNVNYSDNLPTFVTNPIDVTVSRREKPSTLNFSNDNVFIYECEQTKSNPLTVLLKVTYTNGNTVKYHKLLLSTKNSSGANELCKLLRNHNYTITLTDEFTSDKGYDTVDDAISNSATNAGGTIITLDNGNLDVGLNGSITLSSSELTLKPTLNNGKESTADLTATVNFTYSGANEPSDFSLSFSKSDVVKFSSVTYNESSKSGSFTITLPYKNGTFNAEATELGTVTLSCSTASATMKLYSQTGLNTFTNCTTAFNSEGTLSTFTLQTPYSAATTISNIYIKGDNKLEPVASNGFTSETIDDETWYKLASATTDASGVLDLSNKFKVSSKFGSDTYKIYVKADNFCNASYAMTVSGYQEAVSGLAVNDVVTFGASGALVNNAATTYVTLAGSTNNSTKTVNGVAYSYNYKLNSSGVITITISNPADIDLILCSVGTSIDVTDKNNSSNTKTYSLSGISNNTLTIKIKQAGTYTIKRNSGESQVVSIKLNTFTGSASGDVLQ